MVDDGEWTGPTRSLADGPAWPAPAACLPEPGLLSPLLGAGWEQLPHSRNATGGLLEDRVKFPGGMGATADCAASAASLPAPSAPGL